MIRSTFKMFVLVGSLLLLANCGGDDGDGASSLGDCPTDSAAQEMTGAMALMTNCLTCHADPAAAGNGVILDTAEDRATRAEDIYAYIQGMGGEAGNGIMPPNGLDPLSADEIEAVRVLLACEAQ